MKNVGLIFLVVLLLIVPAISTAQTPDADIEWLRDNIIPLEFTEPGNGYEDLLPLREVIGDAQIVALGEATHGTHEFFTLKHRLIEFLVEEMGFTIVAMEANLPEADRVNTYVQNGEGNPTELLAGLYFRPWFTQEILDLINWMWAYNESHSSSIKFTGFDMQFAGLAMENVVTYLETVDENAAAVAQAQYSCFVDYGYFTGEEEPFFSYRSQSDVSICNDNLQAVYDNLAANQEIYAEVIGQTAFEYALVNARLAVYAQQFLGNWEIRDQLMAANVRWLLESNPDEKVILWAHNMHVERRDGETSMIDFLSNNYGDEMVVMGFNFDYGTFYAYDADQPPPKPEMTRVEVGPSPPASFAHVFRQLDEPNFILDLRNADQQAESAWLTEPSGVRMAGTAYRRELDNALTHIALAERFDVIIHIRETTASHLLDRSTLPENVRLKMYPP